MASKPPCQYFTIGCCKHDNAADCAFSHDRSVCVPGSIPQPCLHFQRGHCRSGKYCLYLHPTETEKPVLELPKQQTDWLEANGVKLELLSLKPKTGKLAASGGKAEQAHADASPTAEQQPSSNAAQPSGQLPQSANMEQPPNSAQTQEEYVAQLQQGNTYYYGLPGEHPEDHKPAPKAVSYSKLLNRFTPEAHPIMDEYNAMLVNSSQQRQAPICRFFLAGNCSFNDKCRYSHDVVSRAYVDPQEQALVLAEFEASRDLECGVCLDPVLATGKQFGLLEECEHVYCLSCIRGWRSSEMADYQSTKGQVLRCPQCRKCSFTVVPSDRFVADPARKAQLLANYKHKLRQIPCRHFDQGRGTCPFGASCFYMHALPSGETITPTVRMVKTQDGQFRGPTTATMVDFWNFPDK